MGIKIILRNVAEKLTGRKCSRCKYNRAGRCCHPDGRMFMKCWHSVTRPGWTGRYEKAAPPAFELRITPGEWDGLLSEKEQKQLQNIAAVLPVREIVVTTDQWGGLLSEEEQHQLQKIKASLQEAGDIARESGLLGED